jgi:hypothetical protein
VVEMTYVDSSNIDQIGYDETESEVHVIFKKSGYYVYSEVNTEVWESFINADSKGVFLNEEFKKKAYPCRKL